MKKLLFRAALSIGTLGVIAGGAAAFSAFEAHIINVTATIENALSVPVELRGLSFGTVFPQEALDQFFDVNLSTSFLTENNVDDVEYTIRQKPKCGIVTSGQGVNPVTYSNVFPQVTEDAEGNFVCPIVGGPAAPVQSVPLPLLCPYLSKHEKTDDAFDADGNPILDADGNPLNNDGAGINSFHGLPGPWTLATTLATAVSGKLQKLVGDINDKWDIDLHVPCFAGQCDQGWAAFVDENDDPQHPADPNAYIANPDDEHEVWGCDLWLEATKISRLGLPQ